MKRPVRAAEKTYLPLPAPLAYAGAVAVEIACSAMLIVGFQARAAAAVFALYCVATAVFFHADFANPDNIFHFMKNVALSGGLLQIVAFGAGAFGGAPMPIDRAVHALSRTWRDV